MKLIIVMVLVMLVACRRAVVDDGSVNDVVGGLIRGGQLRYAQDPATSHCFAYAYVRSVAFLSTTDGGPILTWVPCDSLPTEKP
jgi:hypothetical protein